MSQLLQKQNIHNRNKTTEYRKQTANHRLKATDYSLHNLQHIKHIYICVHIYIYGHALRGPPPSPPLHGLWSRMPPLLWDGVWVPSSPCGVVVGVLGFWV